MSTASADHDSGRDMGGVISVVGLNMVSLPVAERTAGEDRLAARADLTMQARCVLSGAAVVIGSQRQLAAVADELESRTDAVDCIELPKLNRLKELLDKHADARVALLASGDPLFYGIGRWLGKQFNPSRLRYYPAVSSVQLACARMGLSLQDVSVISLHGRPVESLRTRLHHNAKLLILTDTHSHPSRLSRECSQAGLSMTRITVFERLGYPDERVRQFVMADLVSGKLDYAANDEGEAASLGTDFDDLNIVLLELAAAREEPGEGPGKQAGDKSRPEPERYLPVFPGIPDHHFHTGAEPGKGMITKREVRLAILSYLSPGNDEVIWDIGAGCGSVSVELAYWNERVSVYAMEHHDLRLVHLHSNRLRFGVVKNLTIVQGRAPETLADLPTPHKVFIGGSDGKLERLLSLAWSKIPMGGLLVASAVSNTTRNVLRTFAQTLKPAQVQSVEMLVKRGELQPDGMQYTEKLPVEVFRFQK